MTKEKNRLFPEFPEITTQQWEEKIIADLKGKDYEKALVWRTNEGFEVRPYYRAEDLEKSEFLNSSPGEFPFIRGNNPVNNWLIRQDIVVSNLTEANGKALDIFSKGVNSLGFIFDGFTGITVDDLKLLLKDICLEAAEINFTGSCQNSGVTEAFAALVKSGPWNARSVAASADNDPLTVLMLRGKFDMNPDSAVGEHLRLVVEQGTGIPHFRTIGVNGKIFGNSGTSITQELAFSLAMGAEYMSWLTEKGLQADDIASGIKFNFSISSNYFMEIAKLRAGRLLWAQIVKAFGGSSAQCMKMMVHCETGNYNKAVYDPYMNLLRTQTEAMSAGLGGAHSIAVLPFDAIYRDPSEFSERIARNQQILLKEESGFDKVADIPGGSYYIENLTGLIAEQAWRLFLETEDKGGFVSAFREGYIQNQVKETALKRGHQYALLRENLVGVNQFPNLTEILREKIDDKVFLPPDHTVEGTEVETLKPYRAAQPFEALRYKTDRWSETNKRPTVFMFTMGNPMMRRARAQFSCNFFAVAGFEVIDNSGFETLADGVKAARDSGAKIVVVCSSDEEYAEIVPQLLPLLKNEILVVAGNPSCRLELEAVGIRYFIHVKSNLLQELKVFQKILGID